MKIECFTRNSPKSRTPPPLKFKRQIRARDSCNLCCKSSLAAGDEDHVQGLDSTSSESESGQGILDNLNLSKHRAGLWTLDRTAMFCFPSYTPSNVNYVNFEQIQLLDESKMITDLANNNSSGSSSAYSNAQEVRRHFLVHGE